MKNKKLLRIFFMYLLIPTLMIVTTSYAWFYINQQVDVTYIPDVECEAGHSLEISLDGGVNWAGGGTIDNANPKMLDITGDGINLYRPEMLDDNYNPLDFKPAEPVDPTTGKGDYVEIEVMLRTSSRMDVYLSGDSFVKEIEEGTETNSIFGNFSKNYIAGCVRVSVTEKAANGSETLKMLWDPNPYYRLTKDGNNYSFTKTANTSNKPKPTDYKYYYKDNTSNTYLIKTFTLQEIIDQKLTLGSTGGNELYAGNSPILAQFIPDGAEEIMVKTLVIRVWFEGTDREADQALSGGVVKMYFKFNGINKEPVLEANQTKINNIQYANNKYSGLENGFEYSVDGFNWVKYTGQSLDTTTYKTWYWRYPETESNLGSTYTNYKKIVIS